MSILYLPLVYIHIWVCICLVLELFASSGIHCPAVRYTYTQTSVHVPLYLYHAPVLCVRRVSLRRSVVHRYNVIVLNSRVVARRAAICKSWSYLQVADFDLQLAESMALRYKVYTHPAGIQTPNRYTVFVIVLGTPACMRNFILCILCPTQGEMDINT
jgi:hypothetical protein